MKGIWSAALGVGVFLMLGGARVRAQSYTVTDLGTLAGSTSEGRAVNDAGQVVGDAKTAAGLTHGFLYSHGAMQDLGTLGGKESWAYGISSDGQITGFSDISGDKGGHAFLYHDGALTDIKTLGGAESEGLGVNSEGQVVGAADRAGAEKWFHAFFYSNDLGMIDLGTLGGQESLGKAVNRVGEIAGSAETSAGIFHAFFYSKGAMRDLGTLQGAAGTSLGDAINSAGQVAGVAASAKGAHHAFLFSNGVMRDLGTLDGHSSSAESINDAGQVVGGSDVGTVKDGTHAFLAVVGVDGKAAMTDLNTLIPPGSGWVLESALGISNNGFITGYGTVGGKKHAFLLTPVGMTK